MHFAARLFLGEVIGVASATLLLAFLTAFVTMPFWLNTHREDGCRRGMASAKHLK